MSNFDLKILREKDFSNTKLKSIQVKKKNKNTLSTKEITILSKQLMSKQPKGTQMAIQVLSPLQRFHIKGFDDDEISLKEMDEYLDGRVAQKTKFEDDFSEIVITFKSPKIFGKIKK